MKQKGDTFQLNGSRVLIADASRGIGKDLARRFAAADADVALGEGMVCMRIRAGAPEYRSSHV